MAIETSADHGGSEASFTSAIIAIEGKPHRDEGWVGGVAGVGHALFRTTDH